MESSKFINQVNELYAQALEETIALLNACSSVSVAATSWNDVPIGIWGVGLNDDDHICVRAFVNNVGYGYTEDDFPQEWTDIAW